MCLFYLKQSEAGLTAAELAELSGIDKGAISRIIAELEDKGYTVCCETKEKRKYRAKITLTESGESITEKIDIVIEDAVEKSSIGLSASERVTFDKALMLISQNLQRLASY